jgi:hypothetical protein
MLIMGLAAHAQCAARMGQINPFTGAIPLQPTQGLADRLRRSQAASKNLPPDEASGHVVEDPDAVVMISEEHSHQSPDKDRQPKEDQTETKEEEEKPARLDITA